MPLLTPDEWYQLVNDIRSLAERYGLRNAKNALDFVIERSGLPMEEE